LPLYPYRCTQCGHRFEKIQHFNDEPEKVCPKCGGDLERPLTAPRLHFVGAGWYVNDYAAKSSGSGGEATSEKKAETQPEGKTETKASPAGESASSSAPPASSTSTDKSSS
jgi:putative FmdB family regulatory protein